ncbi:MAG TPA: hypothetical protein VGL23_06605 [Chloroflexota bacterium]
MARPRYHLLASAALGGAYWAATGDRRTLTAPLVSGFLIDFDHFVAYLLSRTRFGEGTMFLPLHGWEFLPAWLLLDRVLGLRGALAAGYATHLGIDQLFNEKRSGWAYLISWRAKRRFRSDTLGPLDEAMRHRWRKASPLGLLRWF